MNFIKSFIKRTVLIYKIIKEIKQAKKLIDVNQGLAKRVSNTLEIIQTNIRGLASLLPMLKDLEENIIEIVKG